MDLRAFGVSLSLSVQLAAEEWCFYGRQQKMTWYVLGFVIVSRPLIVVDRMRDTCLHKRAGRSLWCPLGARARDISNTLYRMDLGTFGVSRTSQSSWPHPSPGRRGMVFYGRWQQMTWYVLGFAIVLRLLIVVDRMRDTRLHKRAGRSLWCPLGARARDIFNTLYRMDLRTFGVSRTSQSSRPHPSCHQKLCPTGRRQ